MNATEKIASSRRHFADVICGHDSPLCRNLYRAIAHDEDLLKFVSERCMLSVDDKCCHGIKRGNVAKTSAPDQLLRSRVGWERGKSLRRSRDR